MSITAQRNTPQVRFPERSILESEDSWWIAKVKPRQEKAFAFDLLNSRIEYYLPLYTKSVRRKDTGKRRKSILPLFPSYVPFSSSTAFEVITNKRVVNLIEVRSQNRFKRELQQIYTSYELGLTVEPVSNKNSVCIGDSVEITAGSLKGINGKVMKKNSENRVVLSVVGLGEAMLTVDVGYLKTL